MTSSYPVPLFLNISNTRRSHLQQPTKRNCQFSIQFCKTRKTQGRGELTSHGEEGQSHKLPWLPGCFSFLHLSFSSKPSPHLKLKLQPLTSEKHEGNENRLSFPREHAWLGLKIPVNDKSCVTQHQSPKRPV